MKAYIITLMELAVVLVVAMVVACDSNPNPVINENLNTELQVGRIEVVSAQTILDARAYYRDILVLRDSKTGKEYLAVMGAGVTEMYPQMVGKTTVMMEE